MSKKRTKAHETVSSTKEVFGYQCPLCGEGTIRAQIQDYPFCKEDRKFLLKEALLGVCDRCGEILIPAETQGRLEQCIHSFSINAKV